MAAVTMATVTLATITMATVTMTTITKHIAETHVLALLAIGTCYILDDPISILMIPCLDLLVVKIQDLFSVLPFLLGLCC